MLILRGLCQQTARETSSAITIANSVHDIVIVFAIRAVEIPRLRGNNHPWPRRLGNCRKWDAVAPAVFIFGTTRILDREQWQNPCCALGGPARTLPLPDVPDFNLSQRWRPGLSASDAHSNATRTVAATMEGYGGPVRCEAKMEAIKPTMEGVPGCICGGFRGSNPLSVAPTRRN